MTQYHGNQEVIRRYLLGDVADEVQRQSIEERLLTDDEYYEELLVEEDELIDCYLSGALTDSEQRQFEMHFLVTPERHQKLRFARALSRVVSEASPDAPFESAQQSRQPFWRMRWFDNPYLRAAAVAVIVIGLGLGVWRTFFYQSETDKGLAALIAAYRNQRPIEARISGFDYAPFATVRGSEQRLSDYTYRDRAERILLDALHNDPGPASHHALGRLYLAQRQFDKAVDQFVEALKADESDARIHSDLGAALLEVGKANRLSNRSGESLAAFAESLAHLNRALALEGSLLEALYNRALCYEYLHLPQQAEATWRDYLEKDAQSPWADEARRHLDTLQEQKKRAVLDREQHFENFLSAYRVGDEERAWQAVTRGSCRIGNVIVERLIDEHLELASNDQQSGAADRLRMLAYVGELKAHKTRDRYVADLVRFYGFTSSHQRAALVKARKLVKFGQEQIARSEFMQAAQSYLEVKQTFDRVGNECESSVAAYWLGICYLQLNDKERGAAILGELARACEDRNYKWIAVRSLNGLASYQFTFNEYSHSITSSSRSLRLAEEARDTYGLLSALSFLIEAYRYIGNYDQALAYIERSLEADGISLLEPKQQWLLYSVIAWTFHSLNFNQAAADYQQAALQLALEVGEFSMTCVSYARLGTLYGALQNFTEAISLTRQAFDVATASSNEPVGRQMMAYSALQLGDLYRRAGDFGEAVTSYDRCIELYEGLHYPAFLYEAHKGKLLSYIASHNNPAAAEELRRTVTIYDRYRSTIIEQNNRNSFSDAEQNVFDIAINFEYATMGNAEKAFEYSEASRARSLLDLIRHGVRQADLDANTDVEFSSVSQPFSLTDIRSAMPEGAQLLQFAVLEEKMLIWVISGSEFRVTEIRVAAKKLDETIHSYLLAVSSPNGNEEEAIHLARELYSLLILPVESLLKEGKQLYIVPDKALNRVPFGALVSPSTGRYLVEDHLLVLSPSSSMMLACSTTARVKNNYEERLLSVGDPDFDREAFAGLPNLASARREAEAITALYGLSKLLTGSRATKRAVMDEMRHADVVHLALHSVADGTSSLQPKLLLAQEPQADSTSDRSPTDGSLLASEVYRLDVPRTRLVILSACETGSGRSYRGEGVMSMARAFIAAGVPVVVASLWQVDSDATADLLISFHRYRKRDGLSTVAALRGAQLDMLRNPQYTRRQPYYWASFNVIGGHAEF